jgi:hypothetical protein
MATLIHFKREKPMKLLFLFAAAVAVNTANAKSITCTSKKGEQIYYTEGQLVLNSEIVNATTLEGGEFVVLPKDKLWTNIERAEAVTRNGYSRFVIGGDAWCSYRLALPEDFLSRTGKFNAFLDAYCEENSNSSHRVGCRIL